jgi:hypothetical protein
MGGKEVRDGKKKGGATVENETIHIPISNKCVN